MVRWERQDFLLKKHLMTLGVHILHLKPLLIILFVLIITLMAFL